MAPASLHTDIIGKHGPKAFLEMAASCGIALAGDVAIIGKDGQAIEILGDWSMYEPRSDPPIPRERFLKRLFLHVASASLLLFGSLMSGMAGYEYYEGLPWRDAFLNSAMLLGGMGPVDAPRTDGGKLFAGIYALYSGLVFLVVVALIFAPIVHRIMHRFHWQEDR